MWRKVKNNLISLILNLLPRTLGHRFLFFKQFHKNLNLNNPKTLNEKIHWLELNYYGEREAVLTDKNKVKDYINSLNIKDLYVPKTYLVLNSKNENINFEILPSRFVLKTNHGSGDVYILDKSNLKIVEEAIEKELKLLKKDFSKNLLEYHYSYIDPVVMFEEYLNDGINEQPFDYKFFCFSGKVKCVMVCTERENSYKSTFFDKDWNFLNYSTHPSDKEIKQPQNFSKMWNIAEIISSDHKFVRVDLYNIGGKIYFGEMTFTPAAGLSMTYTSEADEILGSYLTIN
ncbi:TupA-like ATPgrasp [Streptococcus equinus]|jgi:hypothetical protein|nr:TupA-like ATPgrasp [Streptococcus equinus]